MPTISLTDFVDFVIKAGTPKLTKVRQIKARGDYRPAFDFWKPLRDGIKERVRSQTPLANVLSTMRDERKLDRYREAISGFERWMGNQRIEWFSPMSRDWQEAGLTVKVNPELGAQADGQRFLIKLYFKNEGLTATRVAVALELMRIALNARPTVALLDINQSRLFHLSERRQADLSPLLCGEAASFMSIWNAI